MNKPWYADKLDELVEKARKAGNARNARIRLKDLIPFAGMYDYAYRTENIRNGLWSKYLENKAELNLALLVGYNTIFTAAAIGMASFGGRILWNNLEKLLH